MFKMLKIIISETNVFTKQFQLLVHLAVHNRQFFKASIKLAFHPFSIVDLFVVAVLTPPPMPSETLQFLTRTHGIFNVLIILLKKLVLKKAC